MIIVYIFIIVNIVFSKKQIEISYLGTEFDGFFFDPSNDTIRGFAAGAKPGGPSAAAAGPASGANAVAVPPKVKTEEDAEPDKEEKRRRKAAKARKKVEEGGE